MDVHISSKRITSTLAKTCTILSYPLSRNLIKFNIRQWEIWLNRFYRMPINPTTYFVIKFEHFSFDTRPTTNLLSKHNSVLWLGWAGSSSRRPRQIAPPVLALSSNPSVPTLFLFHMQQLFNLIPRHIYGIFIDKVSILLRFNDWSFVFRVVRSGF